MGQSFTFDAGLLDSTGVAINASGKTLFSELPSRAIFHDAWISGAENTTVVFHLAEDAVTGRIPVLVGGNAGNGQFLRIYYIDMNSATSSLTQQTSFADIVVNQNAPAVWMNANNGDKYQMRIRITGAAGVGTHVFFMPLTRIDYVE